MKRLSIYLIFNLFILSVFSSAMLNIDKPIIRQLDCSQIINSILTTMNHARDAYNTWSTDFNYRQMELLKMNEQCVKFSEANKHRNIGK